MDWLGEGPAHLRESKGRGLTLNAVAFVGTFIWGVITGVIIVGLACAVHVAPGGVS